MIGFGDVPRATMTSSHSMSYSLSLTSTGRRRPLASGSPSSILMRRIPVTFPSFPRISTGFVRRLNSIPSSSAWWISSSRAGISALLRRYTRRTSAPKRRAVRAASIATLPAPTTTTDLPSKTGVAESVLYAFIKLTRVRYSLAEYTPPRFSPFIRKNIGSPAPEPMKTASYSSRSSSTKIVLPTTTFVSILTPISTSFSISLRTSSLGRRNSGMP